MDAPSMQISGGLPPKVVFYVLTVAYELPYSKRTRLERSECTIPTLHKADTNMYSNECDSSVVHLAVQDSQW